MDAAIVSQLQSVGFPREQAEALASVIASAGMSKAEIAMSPTQLKNEIDAWKISLCRWIIGFGIAQIAVIVAGVKLLP